MEKHPVEYTIYKDVEFLKPCPFCGNSAIHIKSNGDETSTVFRSNQPGEYACGNASLVVDSTDISFVVGCWNTRIPDGAELEFFKTQVAKIADDLKSALLNHSNLKSNNKGNYKFYNILYDLQNGLYE